MIKRVLFIVFLVLLVSAPAFAQSSQSFSLKDGYNFVSFTINPSVTPSQLKSSTSVISDIYSYNAAAGSFLSAVAGELTSLGAGKGYIIKTSGAATASAAGTTLSSVNVITLKAGFNLVGFSKVPETLTFSQLMQRSQSIKGLYKWNAAAGSFLAVVRNGSNVEQLDGSDPSFKAGESYFFNMYEETTLDYNGTTVTVGGSTANRVSSPTFTPAAGTYTSAQTVTIYCATSGASIRYTTDGSTPTSASSLYITPITVSQSMTISAIGIKAGLDNSYVSTAAYTFGASQAPAITSVTGTSVDNGNDTVKVFFNTSMNKTSVEMASNWQVKYDDDKSAGGETALSLTATSFFYDSNALTLTITLKKVENSAYLPNGKYVVVAPNTSVKNSAGTSITATPIYSASVVSGDITAPNPPAEADKSKLGFSNAANKVSIVSGPLTTNREATILEVYTGASQPSAATAPTQRSAIKTAAGHITGDAITGIAAATAGHGVWYRYSDGAGNKSAWLADGTIPADPVVTTVSLNNSNGAIIVGGTAVTSSTAFDSIQVYYDDNGSGAGLTLLNYTAFAMINGTNTTYNATAKGAWTAVPTGKLTSYAIKNSDDNISSRKYDSSNPPAVMIPERIYISAHDKKIGYMANINGSANTGLVLYIKVTRNGSETVYKYNSAFANNLDGSFTFAVGTATNQFTHVSGDVITATFPRSGDEMSYALEAASKLSTYRADGTVPAAPDASKLAYNAATGYVTVTSGATTNTSTSAKLTCYQSNDAQGSTISEKGSKTSADLSGAYTFQASTGGVISSAAYVIYTLTNEYGNISAYSVDGTVPAAPVLPAATALIAAGDGGLYALAGFVNDHGSKAVVMRPGISLVTGEALSLKAVAGSSVTMTAKATLSATPVFGEQTPNVVYSGAAATDGDTVTGSFNFTTINSGAVSVGASIANVNGNASVFSVPVTVQYQADSTPPALSLITAVGDPHKDKPDCYAVDAETDGKLNSLVLKFNKNIKINGSLNIAAGAGYFHNGVTVYNGTSDTPLTVSGYSLLDTDKLVITFNNAIAGTGVVKINIVNADGTNFLSDLYGNKFAAINLNASSTAVTIPDKVAPPPSKIIPANLSFNNQNGYVILSSASLPCGESARLEIFLGANPLPATAATASALNFVTQHDFSATTPLLTVAAARNANDGVYYRLADNSGNKSAWVADGSIPAAPDIAKLGYSAESGNVTVLTGVTTNSQTTSVLKCYQSSDNAGTVINEKGSKSGVNLSEYNATFTASTNGVIQTGAYVLYTLTNENGNISAYAIDGVIPAIPVLPAADSLVAAGDGGLNAKAGYVNAAGQAAVTMRPAIALTNGEGLTIKTVKTNTIKMTARVSADFTPVFGTQNASVIFAPGAAGDGSSTAGSLNFTTLSTGEVAVSASKINVNGNASLWSEAKNVNFDTSVYAPLIVIASCYAVDDEKDGNINSLVLKFDKPIKINGTLDNGAAAGNFHNGITAYDGIMDKAQTVTGYAIENNDQLKITLNNLVAASGRVKINITNAHATNFLSDLYGNKLAAVNLNASSSAVTIPDLVAPSDARIVAANLSFSNASGKIALSTASIACGEMAKLEVFFGSNPSDSSQPAASKAAAATHDPGDLITGIAAKSAGNYVFFRLVDESDNRSAWVVDGAIPASPAVANLTWSDSPASTLTISNSAVADANHLLRIYRKNSTTYTYLGRIVDGSNNPLNGPYSSGSTYNAKTDANAAVKVYDSASDYVAYTLFSTGGHESAYANATNAPPDAPQANKLYVNAQDKTINYSASLNNSSNNTMKLYIKLTRGLNVATYKASSAFNTDAAGTIAFPAGFTLVGAVALADFPVAGDAIEYALENASGQISSYTADGTIPTAPLAANKFVYNASLNTVTYQATINGSANTAFKLFVEGTKGAVTDKLAFFSNGALAAGPASVSLADFTRTTVTGTESNVYDSTPAIAAGIAVKYGVIDANGNVSALTSAISVPAAPLAAKLSYNAATGSVSAEAGVTTEASTAMSLNCYQADSQAGSGISSSKGSVTGINFSANNSNFLASTGGVIAANKYILYTLTDSAGNVSAYTADGLLPAAPDASKLFYAANESADHVTVFSGATTSANTSAILTCYQSSDAAGSLVTEKGSKTGVDLSGAYSFTANSNGGVIGTGKYVLYTLTNENKNVSAYIADGTIPTAPTLPAAASLIAAGDGGAFASAGHVNSAGKLAVKMRPALALLTGEAVSVKVTDEAGTPNVIKMSAGALSGVTPVFGEQTAGVTYSGSGNITTGSFDFTTMSTADLAVAAALTNTNGNSSAWSSPAIDIIYDTGNAAPAITIADCLATDDDGDGKLNTLALKFSETIKINGTLSNTADAGSFHNGITVHNGTADAPLIVTGYSVSGDNNDKLIITFDDSVTGTGRVKINIVNAHASNFLSDYFGLKLAAINLNASDAPHTILDMVAPAPSKIIADNLFYNNAVGSVTLANSDISCGETAKLEVYFGSDPTEVTVATAFKATAASHVIGTLISSIASQNSVGVYYRLVDDSSNKSAWVSDGSVPTPPASANISWSDETSKFTVANLTIGDTASILRIYRRDENPATPTYTYLGRAVTDDTNTDKKGVYAIGVHWAKQDGGWAVKVYNDPKHFVAYTLYNDHGNESAYAIDANAAPTAPAAAKLFVNAQDKTINYSSGLNGSDNTGLRLCLKVKRGVSEAVYKSKTLFTNNNSSVLTFMADFDRTTTTSLDDFPVVGDAVEYALETETGKISAYTADGTIPAGALNAGKFNYNASTNLVGYLASINGTANTSYKLYVEAVKSADKVVFYSSAALVEATATRNLGTDFTRTATPAGNEANVYSTAPALVAGASVKYALIDNTSGNISPAVTVGTVPAAPDTTKLAYSLAAKTVTTQSAVSTNTNTASVLKCYQADNTNGLNLVEKGTKTGINFSTTGTVFTVADIAANKYALYTLTDENGNTSAYAADGMVPDPPLAAKLAYSAINGDVSVTLGVTTNTSTLCIIKCYQADSAAGANLTPEKGSKTGIDLTLNNATFSAIANGGIIAAGKYVIYTLTNENGNTSNYTADGTIPQAPGTAALSDLAIRQGSAGKYKIQRVDATTASDITASMDVLFTLDSGTVLTKCGSTDAASAYTFVADIGDVSALLVGMTPKYAYRNPASDNISSLSAADGAVQTLSSASLEPMGGVITFTYSAAINGLPTQEDFDTSKSGVMALAANAAGTLVGTPAEFAANWTISGDDNITQRIFTIKSGAQRAQSVTGQIMVFGDGTTAGGKLFNLTVIGTKNIFESSGGNMLIPASADRKISFNVTSDLTPVLNGAKGETGAGVFTPLANGISITNGGNFHLEFNKPVVANLTTLSNSTTTAWASGTPPVFNAAGAALLASNLVTMVLDNTANPGAVTTNDSITVTKTSVKDLMGKSPDTDYKFTVASDVSKPVYNTIAVQSAAYNNNVVALTFSKSVWWGINLTDPAHITATVGGVGRTVSAISPRAKGSAATTLNITLAGAAITDGQAVTVTITGTGAANIKDSTANENTLDTGVLIRSTNYAADTTPPSFDSISVQSVALGGNVIKLTFNEPVWWSGLGSGDITVSIGGENRTLSKIDDAVLPNSRVKASAATTVNITVDGAAITNGQAVFIAITLAGSAKIKDNSYSENVMQGSQNKTVTASVSASPNPNHFFANARTKNITITGSTANATARIYVNGTFQQSVILGSNGGGSLTLSSLAAGNSMSYSLTETGKIESVVVLDGSIPQATIDGGGSTSLSLCMQAAGVTDKVKSNASMVGSGCYLLVNNASYTGYVASANLTANTWVTPKSSRGGVNDMPLDAGTVSYQFENVDGNASPEISDGSILAAPDSALIHAGANGMITSSSGLASATYTVYYTVGSNPPVSTLNENTSKMLINNTASATTMVLPAVNSTVVGDVIQWATYDSGTGNYSEGSLGETLVGVGNEASAYKNQEKYVTTSVTDIFVSPSSEGVSYLKVLFTGAIVVTITGDELSKLTEISGPVIGATNKVNSTITAVAGKTSTKVSKVLKIANKLTPPTFGVHPGTTKFNLTSATMKITDAFGNAVFPATAGATVSTTGTTETDD